MENIDDFMQRKFDSDDPASRFPFQEEYWEQAQALIEADERRRKRRRLLFWWCTASVLTAIAVLWMWLGKPVPTDNLVSSHQPAATTPATEKAHETMSSSTSANSAPVETNGSRTTNAAHQQAEKIGLTDTGDHAPVEDLMRKEHSAHLNTTEKSGKPATADRSNKNLKTFKNASQNHSSKNADAKKEIPAETANLIPGATSMYPENTSANAVSNPQTAENMLTDMPGALPVDTFLLAKDSLQVLKQVDLLDLLALPFAPAKHAKKKTSLPRFPYQPMPIKPVVDKRFALEAGADVTSWNAGTGFAGQLATTYALNHRWKIYAGVQFRYLPLPKQMPTSADSTANISVQYRYSFGLNRLETRRLHQAMNTLEIPVGIRWQRGRLGISAALAPGILLSVKDRFSQIRETTLGGEEELDDYSGLGEKTGFKNSYLRMSLAAEWRILPQLGLHIQGNYRPGSILTPSEATTPDKNFWYGDAGFCWHF